MDMQYTGLTRPIDNLGRIVIPMDLRRKYSLSDGDRIEFMVSPGCIILRKAVPACIVCGSTEPDIRTVSGIAVCKCCAAKLAAELEGR